jgi:hypothetical protein
LGLLRKPREFIHAGILPLRFCESSWLRRQTASLPFFTSGFASQTQGCITAGIHAGPAAPAQGAFFPTPPKIPLPYQRRAAIPLVEGGAPCRNSESKARMATGTWGI